jgi:hypothetical protein
VRLCTSLTGISMLTRHQASALESSFQQVKNLIRDVRPASGSATPEEQGIGRTNR